MPTSVHVTGVPWPTLGLVTLRVDTSGDLPPGGLVAVARRTVGETAQTSLFVPAGYLSATGYVQLVNGSGLLFDATLPLDVPVEYLSGMPGGTMAVAAGPVTVSSGGRWWLGDPLRPYLDLALTTRRSSGLACPVADAKIMSSLGDDSRDGRRELVDVAGSAFPAASIEPIASSAYEIRFGTRTTADRQAALALFAPGGTLLLRPPAAYDVDLSYVAVTGVQVARTSADHRRTERFFTCTVKAVEPPAGGAYGWLGARWADLCDGAYPTWAAVTAAGMSWGSLGLGVVSGAFPAAGRTWAEVNSTWVSWAALLATGKTWEDVAVGD